MEKQEVLDIIKEIGTIEDDVARRGKLATLSEELEKDYTALETLTQTNQSLQDEVASVKEENMKLFLRVGESKKEEEGDSADTENKKEKRKFEDLFDEKGGIK